MSYLKRSVGEKRLYLERIKFHNLLLAKEIAESCLLPLKMVLLFSFRSGWLLTETKYRDEINKWEDSESNQRGIVHKGQE